MVPASFATVTLVCTCEHCRKTLKSWLLFWEALKLRNKLHQSYSDTLAELKKSLNKRNSVIFCGAGISFNSGLPLANSLVNDIIKRLPGFENSDKYYQFLNEFKLPFEAFIELIIKNSSYVKLINLFNQGIPNTNHLFVAKIAKEGKLEAVCTTNFDTLIEDAFEREEVDYELFYKEDQFGKIDWKNGKVKIIKIHGSIHDITSLAITLKKVASKKLSVERGKVIDHIFSSGEHKNVLILGYSCSDIFDLSLQINSIKKIQKKIIFIEHSDSLIRSESISVKESNNPFKSYNDGVRLYVETEKIIKDLWNLSVQDRYEKIIDRNNEWINCVNQWEDENNQKYNSAYKHCLTGHILFEVSKFQLAIVEYGKALMNPQVLSDSEGLELIYNNIANSYEVTGQYDLAEKYYQQALLLSITLRDRMGEQAIRGNLGVLKEKLGNFEDAFKCYSAAFEIAKAMNDLEGMAGWLNNLGLLYTQTDMLNKAFNCFNDGIRIASDIGDLKNLGNLIGNRGTIFEIEGSFQNALSDVTSALNIAVDIDDRKNIVNWVGSLGNIYQGIGLFYSDKNEEIANENYNKAEKMFCKALSKAKEINDKENEAKNLGNLGNVNYSLKDYTAAINYQNKAIEIFRNLQFHQDAELCIYNLGLVYETIGNRMMAERCFRNSRI